MALLAGKNPLSTTNMSLFRIPAFIIELPDTLMKKVDSEFLIKCLFKSKRSSM